jgi:hypothetical protein
MKLSAAAPHMATGLWSSSAVAACRERISMTAYACCGVTPDASTVSASSVRRSATSPSMWL